MGKGIRSGQLNSEDVLQFHITSSLPVAYIFLGMLVTAPRRI